MGNEPKRCPDCKIITKNFGINRSRYDGLQGICRDCKSLRSKEHNLTIHGFLSQTYNAIKQRTKSPNIKHINYKGMYVLNRQDFLNWSKNNKQFLFLFNNWKDNKEYKKTPSVDRINPCLGYMLNNIQWVTQGENSGKTRRS